MKKHIPVIGFILFWALSSLACNLSLVPESPPTGQFACDVLENGAFTTYPVFQILTGGKMTVMGKAGTWQYDADKKVFTFSGEVSLLEAKYKKGNDSWLITILPAYQANFVAANFVNADEGKLRCYLAQPDQ
jgi:hypothetical protein